MKKDSVIHRTQTISGFKGNGRNTQFNGLYLPQGPSKTNIVSKSSDVEANGSARKKSILTSMRRYSRRGTYSDESDSSHHYHSSGSERSVFGRDDSGRTNEFYNYFKKNVQPQINKKRQDYSSRRSWSSFYSDRRGSASVISSIRTKARGYRGSGLCFLLFGLSLFGFIACGYVFKEKIVEIPGVEDLIKVLLGGDVDQQPSGVPSPSPTLPQGDKFQVKKSLAPTSSSSQTPSRSFKLPLSPSPSATKNFTKMPTSGNIESASPSFALIYATPSPSTSLPTETSTSTTAPQLPSQVPSQESTVTGCNSALYTDRKFRYREVAKRTFYDPSNSDGSRYNDVINWLAADDYLDVCETPEPFLIEKMVWALVYFELSNTYTELYVFEEEFTTLEGYLTEGDHCNRHDDRSAYFAREWSVVCDGNGFITELEVIGRDRNEGEFPSEITYLSKLQKLVVNNSPNVFGTIPGEIFKLNRLEFLDLTNLGLSGDLFPESFFAANNENPPSERMKVLKLGSDASLLDSWHTIDKSLMKEPNVSDVYKSSDFIFRTMNDYTSSTFPSAEIVYFQKLEDLSIDNANLVGTIPDLDQMIRLKSLSLWGNRLGGTLPSFPVGIEIIRLKANDMFGNIPEGLDQYTNLTALELGNNPFGGGIPSSIVGVPALKSLHLCE